MHLETGLVAFATKPCGWCGRAAQMERRWTSLSALDRRVGSFFFLWDIFNIFLGAMLVRKLSFNLFLTLQIAQAAQASVQNSLGVTRDLYNGCMQHMLCFCEYASHMLVGLARVSCRGVAEVSAKRC